MASSDSGRGRAIYAALGVLSIALIAASLYAIFVVAPVEERMGIVQKIFYFHVPSAYAMYVGFTACALGSAVYLAKRDVKWDAFAVAGAEVGMTFCAIVLITGPLWARKAWGVWWQWDPRLTTTLLAGLVFASYLALRSFGAAGEAEKRFAAALALVGLVDLPLIHYSVQRWRGVHPTVITGKGGGLAPGMGIALAMSLAAMTVVVAWLIWARMRAERLRQEVHSLEIELARRGALEDR
jgi:heme exporter protein C